jgi:hypothetical protein
VDLAVNRIGDRLAINLVNTSGPHADIASPIHDTIPPIDHLEIRVRCQRKPESVVLQPEDLPLPFDYDNGVASMTMALTNIHSIIMVEEALNTARPKLVRAPAGLVLPDRALLNSILILHRQVGAVAEWLVL